MMQHFRRRLPILLLALTVFNCSFGVGALGNVVVFRGNTLVEAETLYVGSSSGQHARMLVHSNVWATLSTFSVQFRGVPFGHTVSYSDGVGYSKENSTGYLFFYLTPMDSAGIDLSVNPTASVAISMAQEGQNACIVDVEDPTCWKITLSGKVKPVPANQRRDAEIVLFSKHPQMKDWPENHRFLPYALEIENIVLLDYYGGAKHIPVKEYYEVRL